VMARFFFYEFISIFLPLVNFFSTNTLFFISVQVPILL